MTGLIVGSLINWAVLMLVIPLASRIARFSFPGLKESAWKLAIVVLATNLIAFALGPVIGMWAAIVNLVIFSTAMVKWFDVDFTGAMVIVVLNFFVNFFVGFVLAMIIVSAT